MGSILGIMGRKNQQLCYQEPFFAEEDTSLANVFMSIENFSTQFLTSNSDIAESFKQYFVFKPEEVSALHINYMRELADDYQDYKESVPPPFHAIGTTYDESIGDYVYDSKYQDQEHWTSSYQLKNAISKVGGLLQAKYVHEVKNQLDFENTRYDFENCMILYGVIKTVMTVYQPDELALILTLY